MQGRIKHDGEKLYTSFLKKLHSFAIGKEPVHDEIKTVPAVRPLAQITFAPDYSKPPIEIQQPALLDKEPSVTPGRETIIKNLKHSFDVLAKIYPSRRRGINEKKFLKEAYEKGDYEEKYYYEVAVLAGYYPDVPAEERNRIKEKFKQKAIACDLDATINYISAILANRKRFATVEDQTLAKHFLYNAAICGYADAQFLLGSHFFMGPNDVIPANLELAIFWLKKAAAQNDIESIFTLGICYQELSPIHLSNPDARIQPSLSAAIKLFQVASMKGHEEAESYLKTCQIEEKANPRFFDAPYCLLAKRYEEGLGAAVNLTKALGWYRIAKEQGHKVDEAHILKLSETENKFCNQHVSFRGVCTVEDSRQTDRERAENFFNAFRNHSRYRTRPSKEKIRMEDSKQELATRTILNITITPVDKPESSPPRITG